MLINFQSLKNNDIIFISFINDFLSIFSKQFFPFQKFPPLFYDLPFLDTPPYFKEFFVSLPCAIFCQALLLPLTNRGWGNGALGVEGNHVCIVYLPQKLDEV